MRYVSLMSLFASALALGACATGGSPLTFIESNTLGISIASGAPEGAVELTVGYVGRNVAIVPVTASYGNPEHQTFVGSQRSVNGDYDAFSVFANFTAAAGVTDGGKTSKAGFGKFFATGLAADKLAEGFAARMGFVDEARGKVASMASPAETAASAADSGRGGKKGAAKKLSADDNPSPTSQTTVAAVDKGAPEAKLRNLMLVFAQYDSYGLSVGGSTTDLGAGLTLGYRGRNFALVPTVRINESGQIEQINGSGNSQSEFNSLSVLGQFKADTTGGRTLDTGLEMFFTTGSAARWLGEGMSARLKSEAAQSKPANQEAKKP